MPPISELGPDALLEPMTGDELFESLSKKKIAIKTLLLDQVSTAWFIFLACQIMDNITMEYKSKAILQVYSRMCRYRFKFSVMCLPYR